MIEPGDFKFRDDLYNAAKGETVPLEILLSPYEGVILRFSQVGIKEQENGTAVLQFGYELLETANHTETKLRKDSRFEQSLGLLLNHLILEAAESEVHGGEERESYSEEPVEERGVRS